MDWLMHNAIADMPGPYFLLLYGGVIAALIVEALWSKRRNDRTSDLGPPPIPSKPNAYEIAYLRGGANELTRLVVFDLIRRGYLRQKPKEVKKRFFQVDVPKIEQAPDAPPEKPLTALEFKVFAHFRTARQPTELFQPNGLAAKVKEYCKPMEEALREEQMLSTPDRYAAAVRVAASGVFLILALGGYKLAVALEKGRSNFAFLIVFAVLGLVALAIACVVPRLTRRGKEYLAQLKDAFQGLKSQAALAAEKGPMAGPEPALLLVPALFGVAALAGTEYAYVYDLFKTGANGGSAGGCGGGCGGGGGGCGGGGCGGGGCGGCGG